LWLAAGAEPETERDLFRVLLLTGQRRSEVSELVWPELDLDGGMWVIPAARVKNGRPHRLPLVGEALTILRRRHALAPAEATLVFPGSRGRPIAVQKLVERLRARSGIADFRCHDMRRACASGMASVAVDDTIISRVLGHTQPGVTQKHYVQYKYDNEKKAALLKWDRQLSQIITGEAPQKVVSISGAPIA
jgi:integrase